MTLNEAFEHYQRDDSGAEAALLAAMFRQAADWLRSSLRCDFEDKAQDAVLKAWAKLGDYDAAKAAFRSWFYLIVRAERNQFLRERYKEREALDNLQAAPFDDDYLPDPIEGLNERQSEIVNLLQQGYFGQDAQNRLGISRSTYRTEVEKIKAASATPTPDLRIMY